MAIISLVGFAGSGKDTAGQHLVKTHGFAPFSFAESLKDALAAMFCWDREMLEGLTEESRQWRNTVDEWWAEKLGIPNFTPRYAMQRFGTDTVRKHFHPDMWINNIDLKLTRLKQAFGADVNAVLIDGRFPNELDMGSSHGATRIRVKRGPEPVWWTHALIANGFMDKAIEFNEEAVTKFKEDFITWRWGDYSLQYAEYARYLLEEVYEIHESEWAWIGQHIDVTIENDGTIEELFAKIEAYA